jgi:hypothetical protein
MIKRAFATIGFLFLVVGLSLGAYLLNSTRQAQALDATQSSSDISGDMCAHPQPVIELTNKTMSENDSQTLRVHFSNINSEPCVITVALDAPNFDIGTLGATRSLTLPPNSTTAELAWVITAKKVGTFEIAIQSESDTAHTGITVLNVLGLAPWQLQIFSLVSTLFGPMLTAPWWYEQFKGRQSKRRG